MNQQGVLHCEICDAELPNFNSMKWHIQGKRHQNALRHWERKQESAKSSIFVRNFPTGTTEQELWQYFTQFGRVTRVTIVKPKGQYAIIEFGGADSVDYILSQQNHRLNSQNLVVKRREVEVPGAPPVNQFQHGYQHFQRGGNLARGGFGPWGGRGRGGFDQGYNYPMGGGGPGMYDQPGPSGGEPGAQPGKRKRETVDDQIDQYYHEELLEKLVKVKGVQNQLEWLCQNLQVTADEAQTKFQLCEKLQSILGQFFPGCTVNQFGSSVNGFGLAGCDMDIFLDLSTMHGRTWELQPIKLPFVRDFKFLKEKEWGPLIPADVDRMALTDQCKLVIRILTEHLEGIMDPQVVPGGRCPLARFKYSDNRIKCDLTMNNKLALQNTKLLYLYSVLNSRVRLLVYAIRYWGKTKGISGNNKASTKISNYALTLMVLNYLQNVEPPVLPTIEKLSELHGEGNRTKIEGWDCTFAMDWQIIPQSNNTQSAAELLSGFFSYWSAFNFHESVLITRTATDMPFAHFFEKSNMADGRVRSFQSSAINIQDPFVLSHNITQNVNEKAREKVVREFRIAAIKTSVWGNEGFSMTSPDGGGDLIHLLNDEVPDIILQDDQERQENIIEKGRMPARQKGEFEFDIELKPTMMSSKLLKQLQKGGNYRVEWCRRVANFVLKVLKETLMLVVEELPEASEEDRAKIAEEEIKWKAVEKHNSEILARREARRSEKRKALEEKMEQEMEKMREQQATGDGDAEADNGEAGDQAEGDSIKKEGETAEVKEKPKSLLDMSLPVPKKFKRRNETMIDDMIEDSDDGEELIDYKPDEPELKYKRPSDADINYQYFMRAWCMTWARRKKVKNYLTNEEGRRDEGMYMEKLISEAIYQNDRAPLPRPVVGFYCYMESHIDGNETKVTVSMDCKEGHRDFNTFFQFTKIFATKLINKHLH